MPSKNSTKSVSFASPLPALQMGMLADIALEWDRTEGVVKLAELVCDDVVIPAIAELRYAGRRLVDALNAHASGASEDSIRALVEDAKFCCLRAHHDAVDAALNRMSIETDLLADAMGYDVVHSCHPEFFSFIERLAEARQRVPESRANRSDRDEIYRALAEVEFPTLAHDYARLKGAVPMMKNIVGRRKLGIWLSIFAGFLIAAPGYVMSWYFWAHPVPVSEPAASASKADPIAAPSEK